MRFAEPAREPGYAARGPGEVPVGVDDVSHETPSRPFGGPLHPGTDAPSLIDLLEMALDPDAWEAFSRGSAIRRAGRAGFARNVCVAMGNWLASVGQLPEEALTLLSYALSDPEPVVRAHAAWALGRIGSAGARAALSSRLADEAEESVRSELAAALVP
ncbi:MAG: hypothetical protein EA350_12865 [Gemmatimonadales bacterium]|nr:MAG: hypothetical protein EA350_12865 [Gemmatimonadales bacterium]